MVQRRVTTDGGQIEQISVHDDQRRGQLFCKLGECTHRSRSLAGPYVGVASDQHDTVVNAVLKNAGMFFGVSRASECLVWAGYLSPVPIL